MKTLLILLLTGSLVLGLTACDGNVLTNKKNSTIGDDFDNDKAPDFSFSPELPNINSENSLIYPVSGTCDPNAGDVTVTIGSPDATEVFSCGADGKFSGTIDVSGVTSNPPAISGSQGGKTTTVTDSIPENDQEGPATAPTGTAPGGYVGGGSSYNLPISCNEPGEVVTVSGVGLNPSPQAYTCSGTGSENFPLSLESSVETADPNNLTISSTDENGNPADATTTVNVPMDTKGPVVAVSNSGDIVQGQAANFTVTVTDANFSTIGYTVNTSGAETAAYTCSVNPCTVTTGIISPTGTLSLTVAANSVNDDIGNSGDSALRSSSLTVSAAGALDFTNPLPTVNTNNASAYPVSGSCDEALGDVTVNVTAPAASQTIACNAPGQFSGTIDLSGVTSNPPTVSVTQGVNTVNASPSPINDQTPIVTAPTVADQSSTNGTSTSVSVTCAEIGEVVSFSNAALNPNPQSYTCVGTTAANVTLNFATGQETSNPNNVTVSSEDVNGNTTTNTTTFNLPVDNVAPTVVVAAGSDVVEGNDASFTVTVTDGNTFTTFTPTVSSGTVSSGACSASPCAVTVAGADVGALTLTVAIGAVVDAASNSNAAATSDSLNVTDDPSPTITGVTIGSTDGDSDLWYEDSDTVTLAVEFSEVVTVVTSGGTPSISVTLASGVKTAIYTSGTGTDTLNFNFTVSSGDEQCSGSLALGSLALNSGTIKDSIGQDSVNTGLASSVSGAKVDAVSPVLTGPLNVSADDAEISSDAVTTTWSQSDNCAVDHVNMALGTHDGSTCNAPTALTGFLDIGTVTSYQPVSETAPFDGSNVFTLVAGTDYCTSANVVDEAGNSSATLNSDSWNALGLVLIGGAYEYSDGTVEKTCSDYLESSVYNSEGSGKYRIDPDGAGGASSFVAYCDMVTNGGGWTLLSNRSGGTSNAESCGVTLGDFFNAPCGSADNIGFSDSYSIGNTSVRNDVVVDGEWMVLHYDSLGVLDSDDAYTLFNDGSDLFPTSIGSTPVPYFTTAIDSVCDVNGLSCDTTNVFFLWVGHGWFNSARCNGGQNTGTSYKGNYGYCHNGTATAYNSNSLFGDREAYDETKLWGYSSKASDDYQERIWAR